MFDSQLTSPFTSMHTVHTNLRCLASCFLLTPLLPRPAGGVQMRRQASLLQVAAALSVLGAVTVSSSSH